MKIGILTQYYPPETGAPQARLSELASRFVQRGHEVFVLTALPSYPLGRIYPGYRGLFKKEILEGVCTFRTWIYPTQSVKLAPRMANYLSFTASSAIFGLPVLPRLDYLLTESPPLFLGVTGFLLSRAKRARWIFNVSDVWPDSAVQLGAVSEGPAIEAARKLETFCYKRAWLVTGQSREIVAHVRSRCPGARTWHLSNGVDTAKFVPENGSAPSQSASLGQAKCLALYSGLHGAAQGLDQLLDAADLLRDAPDIAIEFLGDGPEKQALIRRSSALGLTNVVFSPSAPRDVMPSRLRSADVSVVTLKKYLPGAVPSKLYEVMASGVPVVLAADGEAAGIVSDSRCGIVVRPGDAGGIAAALRRLASDANLRRTLGENGRKAALQRFDRDRIAAEFIKLLEENL